MSWRRAAIWTSGMVGLALAALAVALHVVVDPERLIAMAAEKARSAWQRELRIGSLSVSLWPVPSLHAGKVEFANPPWAKRPHLLRVDSVRADFELLPLLTGKVRIKNLTLEDVIAGLEEGDDGAVSWAPHDGRREQPADPAEADLVRVGEIRARNVRIHHRAKNEDAEPLHVREVRINADPGLRDVRVEGVVERFGQPLRVKARFAELARLGEEGATSEGRIELQWEKTRAVVEGVFPLEKRLRGHKLTAQAQSRSLRDLLAFMGFERGETAPVELRAAMREQDGRMRIEPLALTLGAMAVKGEATFSIRDDRPWLEARLASERIDWKRTLADAGGTIKPPRQDGEVFHPDPVAWRAVRVTGALRGTARIEVGRLKLGNGLELRNVRAQVAMGDGRLALDPLKADLLGGSASGRLQLDGQRKSLRVEASGSKLSLEQWFRERGRKVPFTGGPMRIEARLTLAGDTYRELAASATGPVSIRMGAGRLASARAGEIEELMVRALAPGDSREIKFACAAARLDFRKGRARGRDIVGARSDVSQLVTSGTVDLREETLDLRGALKGRSGPSLGLAALAGDVQVTGRLASPRIRLDPDARPAIIARAGAAVASAGVTLLGGALLDAADRHDPCEAVFRR